MNAFEKQKYLKYILPAVFAAVFTVAVVLAAAFAVRSGKTLPRDTVNTAQSETAPSGHDPDVKEKYGSRALFDGYSLYSERTEYREVTTVIEEPDGSVIKSTVKKKVDVPVLTPHLGCFIINESGECKAVSDDGAVLLRSVATILPAGVSYSGEPLFSVSGRIVAADGKSAVPAEETPRYTVSGGTASDASGGAVEIPSGFAAAAVFGDLLVLKSDLSGLVGLYSPGSGWIAEPVYDAITSVGGGAFAAQTAEGAALIGFGGETIAAPGVFSVITVSGGAACAYSVRTGWVAFLTGE